MPFDRTATWRRCTPTSRSRRRSVTEARPDAPAAFDAIVAKAMAKEPEDRYAVRRRARPRGAGGARARASWAAPPSSAPAGARRGLAPAVPAPPPPPASPTRSRPTCGGVPPVRRRAGRPRRPPASRRSALPTVRCSAGAPRRRRGHRGRRRGRAAAGAALPPCSRRRSPPRRSPRPAARRPSRRPPPARRRPPTATATAEVAGRSRPSRRSRSAKGPDGVAVSGGRVFVANQRGGTLSVIDPETNEPAGEPIPAGTRPDGVVAGKGVVWVGAAGSDAVERFETQGEPVPTAKVDVGDRPEAISLGKQLVWVANFNDGTVNRDRPRHAVARRRPDRRRPRARRDLRRPPLRVGDELRGRHRQPHRPLDGAGRRRRRSPSATEPRGVIETADAAWIANAGDGTVTRLDRKTGEALGDPITVGRDPRQLAFGFGSVWVTNNDDNTVTRIDAEDRPRDRRADPGRREAARHRRRRRRDLGRQPRIRHGHPDPAVELRRAWTRQASSTIRRSRGARRARPPGVPRRTAARRTGRCCSTTPRRGCSAPGEVVLDRGRARPRAVPAGRRLGEGAERRRPPDHDARRGRVPGRRAARGDASTAMSEGEMLRLELRRLRGARRAQPRARPGHPARRRPDPVRPPARAGDRRPGWTG